jgi:hypothetical protein
MMVIWACSITSPSCDTAGDTAGDTASCDTERVNVMMGALPHVACTRRVKCILQNDGDNALGGEKGGGGGILCLSTSRRRVHNCVIPGTSALAVHFVRRRRFNQNWCAKEKIQSKLVCEGEDSIKTGVRRRRFNQNWSKHPQEEAGVTSLIEFSAGKTHSHVFERCLSD